ncbi:PREDICTED: hydroquinone glucosyltransferase-like [Fragaria vesca subsp. vesca]|uniref:hydroquinone glucosyltransferase-like n=1 Tax=Fragaria vesca subsp. vesca TaxID=101020 RepID=UPI0002C301FF|nr:PREDICTED: hydroquinone glucosyltransferase-like [Fragaria vesca subsp. vesca]
MENNHKASSSSPNIVMIPSPGMGHLIPLVELAKLLVHHHNFTITFIIPTIGPPPKPQENLLQSLPTSINHFFLPPIDFHDLPPETKTETKITLAVTRSLPKIRNVFESLVANSSVVGLVVDLFGTDAFDVAKEFNVPSYLFWSSMAMGLILLLHLPKLDKMVSCEYKDMDEPVKLPGCFPISGAEFPEPLQDRKSEAYKWFLQYGKRVDLAEGVLLNSFMELEPDAIKTLQDEIGLCGPPVYPVGPIIQTGPSYGPGGHECLKWLDEQARGSVLFVSFGSGGTLSFEQLNALASGLEMSGTKFLWVVRSPDNKASNAAFFSVQSQTDPLGFLPKGFTERTRSLGRGLLVPSWAPQSEVLSHGSIGGFLSHCGWNSILESIANGVPLIAWPLYAEQKMNANVLCEGLKVALRPKANENGMVGCEEICRVVKELMEGEEGFRVRERMNGWKKAANKALSEEGSSIKALSELVMKLKKQAWN